MPGRRRAAPAAAEYREALGPRARSRDQEEEDDMYRIVVVVTMSFTLSMLACGAPSFADDIFKKVQRKIARDTVGYAKTHWKIAELTNAADTTRAEGELYDFLSWTLGNPSLVCAQYITAGQNHFNTSFNAAAAAALLGANL